MKKLYHKIMRKIARFIIGFESCPIECRRDLLSDLRNLFISIASAITVILLMIYIVIAWA